MQHDPVDAIHRLLRRSPTVPLALKPTPIQEMKRVSGRLGVGRRAFVMRDDLTGFALGGNKVRKVEYLLADALARKADTLRLEREQLQPQRGGGRLRLWPSLV